MLYGFLNEFSVDSAWFMEFAGGSGTTGNHLMASRFNGSSSHSSSFIGIRELCNNKFIVLLSNNVYNSLLLHTQPLYDSFTPVKWLEQGLGLLQGPYKLRRRLLLPGISVVVVGPHSRVSSVWGFNLLAPLLFLYLNFHLGHHRLLLLLIDTLDRHAGGAIATAEAAIATDTMAIKL